MRANPLPVLIALALGLIAAGVLLMVQEEEDVRGHATGNDTARDIPPETLTEQPADEPGMLDGLLDAGREVSKDSGEGQEAEPAREEFSLRTLDRRAQDLLRLSPEEEQEIGAEFHRVIGEEYPLALDSPAGERIERLARPLLEHHGLNAADFRFSLIDSETVNAFAHVGGYVYVNQGLLDLAEDDDEVQFVLSHEIAHIALGHCSERLTYTVRSQQVLGEDAGEIIGLLYSLIAAGYFPEQEFEADAFAQQTMLAVGKEPRAGVKILRRIYEEFETDEDVELPPEITDSRWYRILVAVDQHLQTHPDVDERVRRIERVQE